MLQSKSKVLSLSCPSDGTARRQISWILSSGVKPLDRHGVRPSTRLSTRLLGWLMTG